MRHFAHHIGDYRAATAHLSILEDGVYRRLLDLYYMHEGPLAPDFASVQRLCGARSKEERAAVETVLREFFCLMEDGWHQARADREIAAYREKATKARENGNRGGRPRKPEPEPENNQVGFGPVSEKKLTINHEPITNTTEPDGSVVGGARTREVEPTQIPPEIVAEAVARHADGRAHTLPADWQPTEDDIAWASKARPDLDRAALDAETERFRLHASANGRTAHRWGANWRLWVSKAHASQKPGGPPETFDQRRIREAREAVRNA